MAPSPHGPSLCYFSSERRGCSPQDRRYLWPKALKCLPHSELHWPRVAAMNTEGEMTEGKLLKQPWGQHPLCRTEEARRRMVWQGARAASASICSPPPWDLTECVMWEVKQCPGSHERRSQIWASCSQRRVHLVIQASTGREGPRAEQQVHRCYGWGQSLPHQVDQRKLYEWKYFTKSNTDGHFGLHFTRDEEGKKDPAEQEIFGNK